MTFHTSRMPAVAFALAAALSVAPAVLAQQLPFEQVVSQLTSPDAGTRLSALRLLRQSGYAEAALPIAPLLSDPDTRMQREALATELELFLGRGGVGRGAVRAFDSNWAAVPITPVPIEVVVGLLTPLKDRSTAVRVEAAYAIGLLGQIDGVPADARYKPVVEALAARMGDPEPAVRLAAARASGRVFRRCPGGCAVLAVDRVGDGLVRLLNDSETAVQGAAMEGLGEVRYERAVTALADLFNYYKTGEMAYGALDTLARIGQPASIPMFRAALTSKDPNFRRAAVEGLARTGDKDGAAAAEAIAAAERDPSVVLALAFGQQRSARAQHTGRLLQALNDRTLRSQAQDYLVELGTPVAPEVSGALSGAAPDVRVALLEVLGVIGTSEQLTAVDALHNDADARVKAAAERVSSRIRGSKR